ncbi:MAG TPA: hypothetical protein VGO57_12130 [Verrucomicrobiae bacterium]|jgi:hypothetical protein
MPVQKTAKQKLQLREILQKQLDERAGKVMELIAVTIAGRSPIVRPHFFRSPSAIHPKHLVIYYVFRTDADWTIADTNGLAQDIKSLTREALVSVGYLPKEAAQVSIHFMSDERIQRNKNLQ